MANDPLQQFADALRAAAANGPVTLNALFIQNNGPTPPPGFDAMLKAAFRLPEGAAGLQVSFQPANVGPINAGSFTVTSATLVQDFVGTTNGQTAVKMTFSLPAQVLQVQIEAGMPSAWTFQSFFTWMAGWPFTIINYTNPTFVFSTVKTAYGWNGVTVSLEPGQNFTSVFTVPAQFQPIFKLVQGLGVVPSTLPLFGPVVLNKANNETILYPDMDLRAPISNAAIEVYFLKAYAPYVGVRVETVMDTPEFAEAGDEEEPFQTPELYFGAKFDIALDLPADELTGMQKTLTLQLQSTLLQSGRQYGFTINVDPESEVRLTPMTVASALMNGNSFFRYVPPVLQEFLTTIGLEGLSMSGPLLPQPGLSSVGVSLASAAGQPITLIGDPTNGAVFQLTSITMSWTLLNPLDRATMQNLVTFTSTFILFPDVFLKDDCKTPGGEFMVSIDQDFNIEAGFEGCVSMDTLLRKLTMGAIGMPEGVTVTFSNVLLSLNPSAKTYSFGFTFDAALDFITFGGQPLIQFQGMTFKLTATTPTQPKEGTKGTTAYTGSIQGVIGVGPIMVNTLVNYDGTGATKIWRLQTSLAQPLNLNDLVSQFFKMFGGSYEFPSFLPGTLTVETFSVDATIPVAGSQSPAMVTAGGMVLVGAPMKPTYKVAGSVVWEYDGIPGFPIKTKAEVGLAYDGNKPGQEFSGSVIGTVTTVFTYGSINVTLELKVGYRFGPAEQDARDLGMTPAQLGAAGPLASSSVLWIEWEGIRSTYDFNAQTITFSLNGWTVGGLIQSLMRLIGDPYFVLPSPWDLLNKISLNGLKLTYDMKPNVVNRVTASYSLPSPIDFGFMKINGLKFQLVDGKVTIAIDGKVLVPGMQDTPLFNPKGPGQDVQNMPPVPGQGTQLFELNLLAMGQRVGIYGSPSFDSTQAVIKAMEGVPATAGKTNPVNPTSTQVGQPYYNPASNWLVAADFGLLKVGPIYTFRAMVVFNDPNLYGLRLMFNGEKAKVLAGLVIDIMYKKITDDIGLYQLDFSFPAVLRNLNFGAVTIILPSFRIQIYTNGDFFFDFGFPYNLDFTRSFTVIVIVYGVPVLGSAGFYFGKLSNATATGLPATTKGTFDPVIVFGLGIQVGVGYYFDKGPLKAGFSVTFFGIIEGTIAAWHPYQIANAPKNTTEVQGNYYFKLKGSFGIIGKLYGSIDFAIIKASVELLVQVVASVTYESFRKIPLSLSVHVSVKVSLKINLGIFSISISFSFAITLTAQLDIGRDQIAPWDSASVSTLSEPRMRSLPPISVRRRLGLVTARRLRFKPMSVDANAALPKLTLSPAVQFTVMTPDVKSTQLAAQNGAFVFLLAMDAPTADGSGNMAGSSFQSLCAALLPWVIDAMVNAEADAMVLGALDAMPVTRIQLQEILDALANTAEPPIGYDAITQFLRTNFTLDVVLNSEALKGGATIFPPLTGFSLTVPDPKGGSGNTVTIPFGTYTTITDSYRAEISKIFAELAARVEDEQGGGTQAMALADTPISMARFMFEDYFLLVARQLVQASIDALDDYTYKLQPGDSLQSILNWLKQRGNVDPEGDNHMILQDIATPNLKTPLSATKPLSLEGLTYTMQRDDTLQIIANRFTDPAASGKRWSTSPAGIIVANGTFSTMVASGVELTLTIGNKEKKYTTVPGDSFSSIAEAVGLSLDELSLQTSLYTMTALLVPSVSITIPTIAYKTGPADTLQSITTAFAMSLDALVSVTANQTVPDLFDATATPSIPVANLMSLFVSDLWDVIARTDQVAQTAGMAARYPLHGVRLPNVAGLGLTSLFLEMYPAKDQPDYGLYQLTGQQFPTPALDGTSAYSITLAKDTALNWVQFEGKETTQSIPVNLTKQAADLKVVLDYARTTGYNPTPTLEIQPDVSVQPKRTSVRGASLWSTSGQAELAVITAPPAIQMFAAAESSQGAQPQPVLWGLPESLLREAEVRQAALTAANFNVKDSVKYLPVVQPQIGTTDPATRRTTFAPAGRFAFSTRVDFQVKRLAQTADVAPQNPFENNVVPPDSGNSGTPARPLAPYNYELIGPGPQDAVLLQRILTAMDSRGEDIVSGLFILYPDNPASPTGLVSRSTPEFLSFITQTNLSTETNPPQALMANALVAGTPPRGIANTPNEFIKLMWELSTVRSGGYYLYYETVGADAGLPDDLFDTNGVATLTLVIAHSRASEPANGAVLTNYTNSFITTDAIDLNRIIMSLESRSAAATTAVLAGSETPAQISAIYGVPVGSLARLNATAPLVSSVRVPIGGITRQVTPADIAGGNVLAKYATYYSQGAVAPITANDIQQYNPGVSVALYSIFRIPPVTYAVSTAPGGPGNTFSSMAAYYSLSVDALADLARGSAGLFGKTSLATDSMQYDVLPALGTGNIGVNLTRADLGTPPDLPASPTPEQKRVFSEAYLYSLYQLLTAGLYPNAFFNGSRSGLSFGPRKPVDPEEAEALRDPQSRRALLSAQSGEPFRYGQALGYGVFSTKNPAPVAGEANVPAQADNPYKGVGTLAQFNLNWVDVFGNRAVTPFTAPPANYTGPLNNPAAIIDYTDALVGLDQWPNVRSHYTYAGSPGAPQFQMAMQLNTAAYEPSAGDKPCVPNPTSSDEVPAWQRQALDDLVTFRQIYFQLHQNYDTLGIPGLAGNAVSMALRNSILNAGEQPLSAADETAVRAFVKACAQYVYNRANCLPGGTPPTLTLSSAIAMGSLTAENIIKLEVAFTLKRQAALVDPALRALTPATTATAAVPPLMDDPAEQGTLPPVTDEGEPAPPPQDLTAFAKAAEKVFVTPDWQMRIGTGAGAPDQPRTESSVSVWAVRMGLKPGTGITYTVGNKPSYYAPMPVATELRTDSAVLNKYTTGKPYPDGATGLMTFSGVDMNTWANSAFAAVDTFLTPTFASPAYILDSLLFDDPQEDGYVSQILEHKRVLAESIADTIRPILETSATDAKSMASASEKMRQALLDRLSNAFIVTAVTVVPVGNASTNQPDAPGVAASPRLFGQPQAKAVGSSAGADGPVTNTPQENFSLTSGKVPLTPSGGDGDTRLAFLFSSKNVKNQTFVSLDLKYAMTHLEFNIRNVPGIKAYEQSSWITFVTGPFVSPIADGANVPVVLRALPTPPTVTAQTATPAAVGADGAPVFTSPTPAPVDLAKWDYGFNYVYLGSAQDAVRTRMQFNLSSGLSKAMFVDPTKQLFDALAQFMFSYPQIATDMETALRDVNASSTTADVGVAQYAVQAFADIIGNVATAYRAWADAQGGLFAAALAPSLVETVFNIVLTNDGGDARIDIFRVSLTPPGTVLPAPIVLIDPDNYQWTPAADPPPGAWASYKYEARTPVSGQSPFLPYADALAMPDRGVVMERLNLFGFQNAWSAVQVSRNQFLVPGVATTETFRFTTPEVSFAEPIVPLLQYDSYNLQWALPGPARFEEYLNAFFVSLLSGAVGQEVMGKLGGAFSYRLLPALTESPRTTLPITLLPPTLAVATAGAPPAFVKPFAEFVSNWIAQNQPTLNVSSQINTDVAIFAGESASTSSQLPLLTIRNVYVDANTVKP